MAFACWFGRGGQLAVVDALCGEGFRIEAFVVDGAYSSLLGKHFVGVLGGGGAEAAYDVVGYGVNYFIKFHFFFQFK